MNIPYIYMCVCDCLHCSSICMSVFVVFELALVNMSISLHCSSVSVAILLALHCASVHLSTPSYQFLKSTNNIFSISNKILANVMALQADVDGKQQSQKTYKRSSNKYKVARTPAGSNLQRCHQSPVCSPPLQLRSLLPPQSHFLSVTTCKWRHIATAVSCIFLYTLTYIRYYVLAVSTC